MALNFDELWIGDEVFVKSKGQNGRWEGPAAGKRGRIRIGEKVFLIPVSDLGEPVKTPPEAALKRPAPAKPRTAPVSGEFRREIDLHIEVLDPDRVHQLPEMILAFQLKKCRSFVEEAMRLRLASVLIIHGKGTGVLKSEVEHLLAGILGIQFTFPKKDGGATEVWFDMTR